MASSDQLVIVAAPDSFKGSVSAAVAASALARAARSVFGPSAEVLEIPFADGGEGTLESLVAAWGTAPRTVRCSDALGRPRTARYGLSADGATGVIEAAEANGLPHVEDRPLEPLRAETSGVGQIALALLDAGVREILLCIGGSATTDGGTGLLTALGARFLDAGGRPVGPGGDSLADIAAVDVSGLDPRATAVTWRIAVDVDNPLCGPRGAAAVFGPQKGATPADVEVLDHGLANLAGVLARHAGQDVSTYLERPGMGAAGGLALGLVALLGAQTEPGARLVADAVGLPEALGRADIVLTAEGRLDAQSLGGKVVDAVRALSPATAAVVVIAGSVTLSAAECRAAGLTAAFSIARGPAALDDLLADTPALIEDCATHACNALAFGMLRPTP